MTVPLGHTDVQDLLGPFVDGELPENLASRVRGHVLTCAGCRDAAALQRGIRSRVRSLPVPSASTTLHERLGAALDAPPPSPLRAPSRRRRAAVSARWAASLSGWAVAAVLAVMLSLPRSQRSPSTASGTAAMPPMVTSALVDYRRVIRQELPAACDPPSGRDLPLPGAPLHAPEARPLSCWSTVLQGHPVSAWAYRWRDRVIVAYVVPESLFFRQPAVRDAVRREGRYLVADGHEGVVAWPAQERGVLVVGDAPPTELDALRL